MERRPSLLGRLRTMILKDLGGMEFGPAALFMISYKSFGFTRDGVLGLRTLAGKDDVEDWELRKFLGNLLDKAYITLDGTMKYTIGNKYMDRSSQGEFVYVNILEPEPFETEDPKGNAKEGNYFALEFDGKGKVWISSIRQVEGLCATTVVSVNGVPLSPSMGTGKRIGKRKKGTATLRKKLAFGDIITISTKDEGGKGLTDFVFMASTSRPLAMTIDSLRDQTSSVVDNPLILENILSFLPTKKVKKLRTVSPLWNWEGLKTLRDRVRVTFLDSGKCDTGNALMGTSNYIQSHLNTLQFPHWSLALPLDDGDLEEAEPSQIQRIHATGRKVLDDVKWLFQESKHNVKSLHLLGGAEAASQLQMLVVVFAGVRHTLTSLNLDIRGLDNALPPDSLDELCCLQELGFVVHRSSPKLKAFLTVLLPTVKNIRLLRLFQDTSVLLEDIARMQMENSSNFVNLSEIVIPECSEEQLKALASLREGSLKSLRLSCLKPDETNRAFTVPHLLQILQRNQNSLKELSLIFNLHWDGIKALHLHFPQILPALKSLSLYFGLTPGTSGYRIRVKFVGVEDDEDDEMDYTRRFPSLYKLSLWPADVDSLGDEEVGKSGITSWRTFLPVLSAFIQSVPNDGRVLPIPTVRDLDVPFLLKGKYHSLLDNLEVFFPNVPFPPELAKARKAHARKEGEEDGNQKFRT